MFIGYGLCGFNSVVIFVGNDSLHVVVNGLFKFVA